MNQNKLNKLIEIYGEDKAELIKYYELMRQIEFIINMNEEDLIELRNKITMYYSFVLEKFGNIDDLGSIGDFVLFLYKFQGLDEVSEFISDRFSIENYRIELEESNNNILYKETFYKIKSIFNKIIDAWKNQKDTDEYFEEINNILNSISYELTIISNCFENKESLFGFFNNKLNELKNNIKDEKILWFDNDINNLVLLVGEVFNTDLSNNLLKRNILEILRNNGTLQEVGVYKNILVNIIDKSTNDGLKVIEIKEDAERFYLSLKNQLFDYLSHSINDRYGIEYYKRYLSMNMSNYLVYDINKGICNIYVSKISELFRIIGCYNIIQNLCYLMNIKIDCNKIDMEFVLNVEQMIQKLNTYNYKSEELDKIYLLYKHSVECSELSNLDKLFIKKKER